MPNRDVVERYFAVAGRDAGVALACSAPGAEFVGPMGPLPFPEGVRAYLGAYARPFPDARFDVTHVVEAGDDVAAEGVWSGTHTGPLPPPDGTELPPTNRRAEGACAAMFTVRDGKITGHRGYRDLAGFMAQLAG